MPFDWKSALGRLDPRKWNFAALGPATAKAREFVFHHRNAVLAASIALLVGLWGGAVLGRVSAGAPLSLAPIAFGSMANTETPRSANAPRAGVPSLQGMAFVRMRADFSQANPRACLEFTRPLSTDPSIHYADYLTIDPAAPVNIDVSNNLLCIGGLPFEPDRQVTIRKGLPAQDGSRTEDDETFTLTFGDRPAYVGFAGSGVILPRTEADGIAIETVNASRIEVEVLRVPDRILSQYSVEPGEVTEEGGWGYEFDSMGADVGVSIYKGRIDVAGARDHRNSAITTVFALGAALHDLRPGAYIVKVRDVTPGAGANGQNGDTPASAYRWVMYTDMALQTFSGASGIDLVVRSLRTARPMSGVTVTLIAQNNDELARTHSDGQGHVHFNRALTNGDGPARARYVMAYGDGDFAALDLNRPAVDLSDRGVDGRTSPGDIDAYMFTERGVYRPGETVWLTGLIRDPVGRAISDRPSTLVLYRPNGTEARRLRIAEAAGAGAIHKALPIDAGAPRGQWRAELLVDGQNAAAGSVSFSVEDFVPQRLRVRITADQGVLRHGQSRPLNVQADFLYGAPGAGLPVEAEGRLMIDPNPFPSLTGYSFGRADESFDEQMFNLPSTTTDGSGHADLLVALSSEPNTTLPLRARVVASVADPGGRMVRESFTLPVRTHDLYLGLKPRFENQRAETGQTIGYDLVAVNANGQRVGVHGLQWQLVREDWSYDWYLDNGSWRWRRTGRDIPVDGGTIDIGAGAPYAITKGGLRDGSYRLIVHDPASGSESSQRFGVGWGGPAEDTATPDMVTVVPPTNATRPGGHAHVEIHPPYEGEAQIVVATDRVIDTRTMHVGRNGAAIDLPVTAAWGPGAYVMVTVMTARDPVRLPVPRRAVGVAYVAADMGGRTLHVTVGGLNNLRPRTHVVLPVTVTGAPAGETVRVVLAAVDEGILNITKYDSPDPVGYFFGRRALGVDLRDDYGRLLNPNLGAPVAAHSGGDQLGGEGLTVVPTKTVSLVANIVTVDPFGHANIPLDIPDFNGTLRVMTVAYGNTAVGESSQDVIVRDPVVAELIMPRFIAPGDDAQAALNIDNVEGPPGAYVVRVTGSGAVGVQMQPMRFELGRGSGHRTALIPLHGGPIGIGHVALHLEGPPGFAPLDHGYDIQSRAPWMPITQVTTEPQAAGATWRAPPDALSRFQPTGQAVISFSNLAGIYPGPLLDQLWRYPYGCSEQMVSVAMPLLYFNSLAGDSGRTQDPRLHARIQDAATDLLDRQTTDGAFGLWHAGDRSATPWLGAYVTDFLTRARQQGYVVPAQPMEQAYSALRTVARLNDFQSVGYDFDVWRWPGSQDSNELLHSRSAAYALYVLAKAGRADIGQVRYFHDTRLNAEPSPLARAQIGAALAFLGDRARAHHAFQMAVRNIGYRNNGDWYQTEVRDASGVLALAAEAHETDVVNSMRVWLASHQSDANALMTQEQVQLLLAAHALSDAAGPLNISMNGQHMQERRVVANAQQLVTGLLFRNDGRGVTWRSLTVSGPTLDSPPPMQAGFSVNKRVYRMDGSPADLDQIRQGDRVVIVVSGAPEGQRLYPTVLVDLLPAGLEIETLLSPADGAGATDADGNKRNGPFAWIGEITSAGVSEARDDRYVASAQLHGGFTFAYIARAVTPGRYAMPAAQVEDMYRPGVMARTATGSIRIAPRGG